MTEYRVIEARKRSFVINAEMPTRGDVSYVDYILFDNDDEITWDNDDEIVWDTDCYPSLIMARKRSFVINAEVNYA